MQTMLLKVVPRATAFSPAAVAVTCRRRIPTFVPKTKTTTRILLGFTADGEHIVVCCGPPANPSWLELRRVRLQWPGLSRPGEVIFFLLVCFFALLVVATVLVVLVVVVVVVYAVLGYGEWSSHVWDSPGRL